MTALALCPHNDDETLFCSYTLRRHHPFVAICFKSRKQDRMGVSARLRQAETDAALQELGYESGDWLQGDTFDDDPQPLPGLRALFARLDGLGFTGDVYAPAVEEGGHEQHNLVGALALTHYGHRVRPYLMYRRGFLSTRGREVVPQPGDVVAKLRAMACYESQIGLEPTAPWFLDDTLREYVP
jgi:LmbE family N-acetylglucosaminyl deacetylase